MTLAAYELFHSDLRIVDTLFRTMEKKALDESGMWHLLYGVTLDPLIINKEKLKPLSGIDEEPDVSPFSRPPRL